MSDLKLINELEQLKNELAETEHTLNVEKSMRKFWQKSFNDSIQEHAYEVANIKLENKIG